MDTFGQRLIKARKASGLKQGALASAVGLTNAAISSMENEKTKSATPENLFRIADALHINPRWLATGKGDMYGDESETISQDIASERLLEAIKQLPENKRYEMIGIVESLLKIESDLKRAINPDA